MSMTTLLPNTFLVAMVLMLSLFSKLCLTTFVSIDCGSSGTTIDTNNIIWTGDNAYAKIGQSHTIPDASGILSTLRAFPDEKQNCYYIVVQNREKVLTRATFFYGNYDNKISPPTFDLHFDGNFWTNVKTSSNQYVEYEAIYVTKGKSTKICVTQTKRNQIPFISSLEVRSLKSTMYSQVDPNHALILLARYAFGADGYVRYPDDVYDRIWNAMSGSGALSEVKSEALDIDTRMVEDHPPKAVLQNAVTTLSADFQIVFNIGIPENKFVPLYINTYFSEVINGVAGLRSMDLYVDNRPVYGPIVPPFGSVEQVYIKKSISSNTSVVFKSTPYSTLPPILNAIEIYEIQPLIQSYLKKEVGTKRG